MALRVVAVALALALTGCSLATSAGVQFLYRKAELPDTQIIRDLCYLPSAPCDGPDNTLDMYLPVTSKWPIIVLVHGGGWDSGDKNFRAGGADVYANVGRYFAARGIGVAVINYRLQPRVKWPGINRSCCTRRWKRTAWPAGWSQYPAKATPASSWRSVIPTRCPPG